MELREECCETRDCEVCTNGTYYILCMECESPDQNPFAHNKWDAENETWIVVCEHCCVICNDEEEPGGNCEITYEVSWR